MFYVLNAILIKRKLELIKDNNRELNINYLKVQNDINLKFNKRLTKKIRIGIYTYSLKNGGSQKITSLIIKYFLEQKIYDLYVYTILPKEANEYIIPGNIFRKAIKKPRIKNLISQSIKNNIDILIYNYYIDKEIQILNNLKHLKTIFYIHQSILYWL